jgi:hypothetical protein
MRNGGEPIGAELMLSVTHPPPTGVSPLPLRYPLADEQAFYPNR